jgi:hypothetical protein
VQVPVNKGQRHRCFGKIRKIFERIGLLLTHAEITYLCEHVLHSAGEKEFYDAIGNMSDKDLSEMIHTMRRKRRFVGEEAATEVISAYA